MATETKSGAVKPKSNSVQDGSSTKNAKSDPRNKVAAAGNKSEVQILLLRDYPDL